MDDLSHLPQWAADNAAWFVVGQVVLLSVWIARWVAKLWADGTVVHKRELDQINEAHAREVKRLVDELTEAKADRARWMELAWKKDQTNQVAVQALAGKTETPP